MIKAKEEVEIEVISCDVSPVAMFKNFFDAGLVGDESQSWGWVTVSHTCSLWPHRLPVDWIKVG